MICLWHTLLHNEVPQCSPVAATSRKLVRYAQIVCCIDTHSTQTEKFFHFGCFFVSRCVRSQNLRARENYKKIGKNAG